MQQNINIPMEAGTNKYKKLSNILQPNPLFSSTQDDTILWDDGLLCFEQTLARAK